MATNRYGFTGIDNDLIGSNRFADPLGAQALWSHFGRVLVPNMTEQTRYASGFYLLICILYLYRKYRTEWISGQEGDKAMSVEAFYILAEQMFAYSTFDKEQKWELPGDRNLRYFYYEGNPDKDVILIGLNRELLGSQLSGGTWGLYRGAAIRSGILDVSGQQLSEEFYRSFEESSLMLAPRHIKEMFWLMQSAYRSSTKEEKFNLKTALCGALHGSLRSMGRNRSLLRKYLIDDHLINDLPLMKEVAEKLVVGAVSEGHYRKFISSCSKMWFKTNADIFEDIMRCEDVTATMEAVFRYLYGHRKESIRNICAKLPLNMDSVSKAFISFSKVARQPEDGVVGQRYKMYINDILTSDKTQFVESILRIHEAVVVGRGGSSWIESDGGKLKINVEYGENDTEELDASPGVGWMNPYYLDTLSSVYKGLR